MTVLWLSMWDTTCLRDCLRGHPGAQFPGAGIQVAIIAAGGDQIEVGLPSGAGEDLTVCAPGQKHSGSRGLICIRRFYSIKLLNKKTLKNLKRKNTAQIFGASSFCYLSS